MPKELTIYQDDTRRLPDWMNAGEIPAEAPLFLAKYQGHLAGYAFLSDTDQGIARVSIFIQEADRGRHVGRALLERITQFAQSHGYGGVMLYADLKNARAQALADRAGYVYVGNAINGDALFVIHFRLMRPAERPLSPAIADEMRVLREFSQQDQPLVEEFFAQMGGASRAFFNRGEWNLHNARKFFAGTDPAGIYWLSQRKSDGRMDGYVFLKNVTTGIPMLGIAVREDTKGMGLGTRLIDHAIAYAKRVGAGGIQLTVHPANVHAQHLYEKKGFVRFGMQSMEYLYYLRFDHDK